MPTYSLLSTAQSNPYTLFIGRYTDPELSLKAPLAGKQMHTYPKITQGGVKNSVISGNKIKLLHGRLPVYLS